MAVEIATAYFSLLPDMSGVAAGVRNGLRGADFGATGIGQAMGRDIADGLASARSDVQRASAAVASARSAETNATEAVTRAEQRLGTLRERGTTSAGELERAEDALTGAQRTATTAAQNRQRAVQELSDAQARMANSSNEATESSSRFGERLSGLNSRIGAAAKSAAGFAVAAAGIGTAMELATEIIDREATVDKLAASLGATPELAAEYGKTAGEMYVKGYGGSFDEVAEAIGVVTSAFTTAGFEGEASLDQITARALDFAKVYGVDVAESVQTTSQLVTNGLAKDSTEAFDLMTASFQRIPVAMRDEVPEIINEYGVHFRNLGFNGQEAFALLVDAAHKGKWALDKTGDALKEFTLLGSDMSQSSQDAYKAIGLDAQAMSDAVASGGQGAREALTAVANGLLTVEGPAERANLAIALFGTPVEDLAVDQIPQFLEALAGGTGSMDAFTGSADQMATTLHSNTATSLETLKRQLHEGLIDALGQAAEWIQRNQGVALGLGIALGTLTAAYGVARIAAVGYAAVQGVMAAATGAGTAALAGNAVALGAYTVASGIARAATAVWTGIQWLLNAALTANPIGLIVLAIAALVAGFVLAYQHSDTFRAIVQAAFEGIKTAATYLWENVLKPYFTLWVEIFKKVGEVATWLWDNAIQPAFSAIQAAATQLWDDFLSPILNNIMVTVGLVGQAALWLWDNAFRPALDAIGKAVGWLWDNVLKPYFTLWVEIFQKVGEVATWLWEKAIKPAFDAIGTAIDTVWKNIVSPAFDLMKSGIGLVGDAFSAAGNVIKSVWNSVLDVLRPVAHAIGNALSAIPETIGPYEIPGAKTANALGEKLKAFRTGGKVDGIGTGTSDSNLAWVSHGEFIEPADAVTPETLPLLEAIRSGWVPSPEFLATMVGVVPGYAGGGAVGVSDSSISETQRGMWEAIRNAFPEAQLTSATRYAEVGAGYDFHMQGKAVDVSGPNMPAMAQWIASNYPGSLELIHGNGFAHNIDEGKDVGDGMAFFGANTMADHNDHVHWAMSSAPSLPNTGENSGSPFTSNTGASPGGGGGTTPGTGGSNGTAGGGTVTDPGGTIYKVWVSNWPSTANITGANTPAPATTAPTDPGTEAPGNGNPGNNSQATHPLKGTPLTGKLFNGNAPWYMADSPEKAVANLQTQAGNLWETTQSDVQKFFQNNWKEMLSTGASLLGMGAGGSGGETNNWYITPSDPMSAASAVERVWRRKTLAQQRTGGLGR